MDRKAHAISFARQAYLRQGLDTLYGQSFDDLLLPELDDAWDVAEAEQLIWCEDPKASPQTQLCGDAYVFRWNIQPDEIAGYSPKNSFQQRLKAQILAGK